MDVDDWGPIPAEVLEGYFSDLDEQVRFLAILYNDRRKLEALTLCCVYIESLAQKIYPTEKKGASKEKFVKVLCEFGDQPELCLVHPPTLAAALTGCGSTQAEIAKVIAPQIIDGLYALDEFLGSVTPLLTSDEYAVLEQSTWHGTVAAQTYHYFRNPLVHRMYSSDGVILGGKRFGGFDILYPALWKIAGKWKEVLTSNVQAS